MTTRSTILIAAALQIGADDGGCGGGPILRDPGFDLWCGDRLCAWDVVRGDVRRVGTWHEADAGVEFVGDDAAIEQVSSGYAGSCIKFSLIANVSSTADVFLDVDVAADGTVDHHERIPTSSWKPIEFHLFIEQPVYQGIRFELTKQGPGEAVLAQIGAEPSTDCQAAARRACTTVGSHSGTCD